MPSSEKIPLVIEWNGAVDAEAYDIHGHVAGDALLGPVDQWTTTDTKIKIMVPARTLYEISVFSRRGALISINAEKAMIYATRWSR